MASYTTNATLGSIPIATVTTVRATTVMAVDGNERGLLITRRTIRTPIVAHAEDTKRVVPFQRRLSLRERGRERERRGWRDIGRFLEGFYILSRCNFTREAVFEGLDGDQ